MARAKTVFVVSRLNWRPLEGRAWWLAPGTARLAAFPTRDEAEVERAKRETNARNRVNPFRCGKTFAELTPMPEAIFLDWVRDAGLSPPKAKKGETRDWATWWDATRPEMSGEQHAKLWEGLNQLHFFRVDERPNNAVGYALLWLSWDWQDNEGVVGTEGGAVEAVYRTRARALEETSDCEHPNAHSGHWHPSGADLFDPETYWEMAMSGGPRFDIVEIELEGLGSAQRQAHLVVRRAWQLRNGSPYLGGDEHVPVRAFASKEDAESYRHELDSEFRLERDPWAWFEGGREVNEETEELMKNALVGLGLVTRGAMSNYEWWQRIKAQPTPEQRAQLWAEFPDCKAYEVIKTKLRD